MRRLELRLAALVVLHDASDRVLVGRRVVDAEDDEPGETAHEQGPIATPAQVLPAPIGDVHGNGDGRRARQPDAESD